MSENKPLRGPSFKELEEIACRDGLQVTQEELQEYADMITKSMDSYKIFDEIEEPLIPFKYPRTSGYRPSKEENPLNAWWYKTDIKGASSGKLLGKRVAIKDSILVAGVPMTSGSLLLEGYVPDEDATVVTKVLDAGGHVVGKTSCEDLCRSANSFTCATGPVLNPYDNTRSSGGSSCGNAVLLQQGEIDMAIGGDQGGSIRIPSSWCGTVGLKPTHGLVPYTGAMSCEATTDHLGPMTRNVQDCALLLEVIAGWDHGNDPRQPSNIVVPEYSKLLTGDIAGKKVAILSEGFTNCEEDVIKIVKDAIKQLSDSCNITIDEVSIPEHNTLGGQLYKAIGTESYFTTGLQHGSALQGVKCHQNVGCIDHMQAALKNKTNLFTRHHKLVHLSGAYMKENYGLSYLAKSYNLLPKLVKAYNDILDKYEVILMPTSIYKAAELPKEEIKTLGDHLHACFAMTRNTSRFNLTGHPALSMNVGFSEGLPVGLQIVGKHWDEMTVLNVAYAFEKNIKLT